MYLIHNTNTSALKLLLKDGYLKSYSLLEKTPEYNEGSGLYTDNRFVYFSCTDKLFDKKTYGKITLYFNSKILFNKSFYVSTTHSPYPNDLGEWYIKNDKGKRIKMYKRKYDKYYKKYDTVLKKLYDISISMLNGLSFQAFQQVAVLHKVNLNELVAISFRDKSFVTDSIINYINKYYPNVIIRIN